ncbi:GTPase RsgA, partial [Porphyromonas sp.]
MRGRVIKVIGNNCAVHVPEEGRVYSCLIKGRVRIQGIRSTNPVVVGDWVHFTPDPQQEVSYIESLEPRRNYIIRRATNLSKESHILAANIDLALLMVTIARPRTSYTFIDRFLATAEAYRIPTEILINKVDDLKPDEEEVMRELTEIYT